MSELKYARIIQQVSEMPWAILPQKLAIIRDLLAFRAAGGQLTPEEIRERLNAETRRRGEAAANGSTVRSGGAVAVLSLVGTIIPRADLLSESSGAVSVARFRRNFNQALADPEVSSIVIDVDSPGGQVGGVSELANEIFEARGTKPITAVANRLAASAAYWLASAADELAVTPSGEVGSIGVFAVHQDISGWLESEGVAISLISAGRFKTEGNPYEPLTDEGREAIQGRVDEYYEMFTSDVARFRGVDVAAVRAGFGEGRVVGAETAVREGMADRVATLDAVISGFVASQAVSRKAALADVDWRRRRLRLNERL